MTYCQVMGASTCTHILIFFPFEQICQSMVLCIFFRLCSAVVLLPIPLCDTFLNAIDHLAFLIPVYPCNSLHHTTLVSLHTINILEKRLSLHQGLPFFLSFLRFKGKHCFSLPLSLLWLKRKYFTEVIASTGTFILVCFGAGWQREGSLWAPWQGGISQGSDRWCTEQTLWCCSGLLCIVQVVVNHLARVERRSELGRRWRITVMSQYCECRTCLVCAAQMFCLFILPILIQ